MPRNTLSKMLRYVMVVMGMNLTLTRGRMIHVRRELFETPVYESIDCIPFQQEISYKVKPEMADREWVCSLQEDIEVISTTTDGQQVTTMVPLFITYDLIGFPSTFFDPVASGSHRLVLAQAEVTRIKNHGGGTIRYIAELATSTKSKLEYGHPTHQFIPLLFEDEEEEEEEGSTTKEATSTLPYLIPNNQIYAKSKGTIVAPQNRQRQRALRHGSNNDNNINNNINNNSNTGNNNSTTAIAEKNANNYNNNYNRNILRHRKLLGGVGGTPTTGTNTALLIRASGIDGSPKKPVDEFPKAVFGRNGGDIVNLANQLNACSNGALQLQPAEHALLTDGAIDIYVQQNFTDLWRDLVVNWVLAEATTLLGDLSQWTNVMVQLPRDVMYGSPDVVGFATVNGVVSVFKNDMAMFMPLLVHEYGHNLGLHHSGQLIDGTFDPNDDHTDMMGNIDPIHEPRVCYNGAKTWALGWYDDYNVAIDLNETITWEGTLIGIQDLQYKDTTPEEYNVVVRILDTAAYARKAHGSDLFLIYNRKEGANQDVYEFPDMVTVVQLTGDRPAYQSVLLDGLNDTDHSELRLQDFGGFDHDVVIQVCNLDHEGRIDTAQVRIYLDDSSDPDNVPIHPSCKASSTGRQYSQPTTTPGDDEQQQQQQQQQQDNNKDGAICGDGICSPGESCDNCPDDCKTRMNGHKKILWFCCYGGLTPPSVFEDPLLEKYATSCLENERCQFNDEYVCDERTSL